MPTIKVNTSRLSGYESDMQSILSRVNSIMGQFDSVSRNLDWDIRAESNINSRLSRISRELSAEARGISGMKNYLGNAVRQYNTVENTNKKNKLKDEVSGHNAGTHVKNNNNKTNKTGGTSTSSKTGYTVDWAEDLFKVVSEVGNVGSIASSIYTLGSAIASGKDIMVTKSIVSALKDSISRFGTLAENAYSSSPSVKKTLFGDWTKGGAIASLAKKYGEDSVATKLKTFGTSLYDEFIGKYKFSNATTVGSKIKVATKWGGTALSFVTSGIDNYKEYSDKKGTDKEISAGRAVTETVLEGAIDIGIGAVATASATAILGASAPAVAVGAAAVGAVWILNTGVEALTKKNPTEFVSDFIIDEATAVGKSVGSAAKKGFNAVTKWGKSLFGG